MYGRHRGGFTEPFTAGEKSGFTEPITADKTAVFQYRGFSKPSLFQKCLPQKPHIFKTHTVTVTAYRHFQKSLPQNRTPKNSNTVTATAKAVLPPAVFR